MFDIVFYKDENGVSEVGNYIQELTQKANEGNKDAKVNKNKIFRYLKALGEFGTRIGNPVVKHIEGDLWELRPLKNRIFFFYWKENKFILVHYYIKKTQKTPKKEIDKAMFNIKDWIERNG